MDNNYLIRKFKDELQLKPYKIGRESYIYTVKAVGDEAREAGNAFIASVCDTVAKYGRCSEKQAYCIARFWVENGYTDLF